MEGVAREQLKLENLAKLDFGKIPAAFDAEVLRCVADCKDRPLDDKPRKVSLTFNLWPKADVDGTGVVCQDVDVECEVTSTVPKRRTRIYTMRPTHDDKLAFQPDSPENPDQLGIEYNDKK